MCIRAVHTRLRPVEAGLQIFARECAASKPELTLFLLGAKNDLSEPLDLLPCGLERVIGGRACCAVVATTGNRDQAVVLYLSILRPPFLELSESNLELIGSDLERLMTSMALVSKALPRRIRPAHVHS